MPLFELTRCGLPAFERKALSTALQTLLQELGWQVNSVHVHFLVWVFDGDMSCTYFHVNLKTPSFLSSRIDCC